MTLKTTLAAAAAAVSLLGAVDGVQAAPVTDNFTSGQATLSLIYTSGNLLQPGSSIAFTGTQATFDASIPQLTSFQFNRAGVGSASGAGLLTGTTFSVTNLNIVPGGGYGDNSPTTGTNPYSFNVGPVSITGSYSLSGAITQGLTPFSQLNPSFAGTITTSGSTTLQLLGITLGLFPMPAALGGGNATLKADITFTGAVPVPAAAPLFGSALGLLGLPFFRRRKTG